jgi:hypothetical protein
MIRYFVAILLLASSVARSAEIDAIAGQYVYDAYKTTLKNGAVLSLQQLGAKSATLAILPNMTVRMEMKMLDGTSTVTEAKILEVKTTGTSGYFMAQWPGMDYPVKEEFTIIASGLSYVIRFTNPADTTRYGAREEATLKRAGGR